MVLHIPNEERRLLLLFTWVGMCESTICRERYMYTYAVGYIGWNMYKYIYVEICVYICCCYMGTNMYKYMYCERDMCMRMLLLKG